MNTQIPKELYQLQGFWAESRRPCFQHSWVVLSETQPYLKSIRNTLSGGWEGASLLDRGHFIYVSVPTLPGASMVSESLIVFNRNEWSRGSHMWLVVRQHHFPGNRVGIQIPRSHPKTLWTRDSEVAAVCFQERAGGSDCHSGRAPGAEGCAPVSRAPRIDRPNQA